MESLVRRRRRRISRDENRQDIGEKEARYVGKKIQSCGERTDDGTRTEELQEVEKRKTYKIGDGRGHRPAEWWDDDEKGRCLGLGEVIKI